MVAAGHRGGHPMRDAPLGTRRRKEHRSVGAGLQRREERLFAGAIVDERDALLRKRGAREGGDPGHHRGSVPGRVLERERAHSRAHRGQELRGARQRRVRSRVIHLAGVAETPGPRRDEHHRADRIGSGRGERIREPADLGGEDAQHRGVVLARGAPVLRDACRVDDGGERTQLRAGGIERRPGGRRHIPLHVDGSRAGGADRGERRLDSRVLLPAADQRQRAARSGERHRELGAHAAPSAGDEHDVARSELDGVA